MNRQQVQAAWNKIEKQIEDADVEQVVQNSPPNDQESWMLLVRRHKKGDVQPVGPANVTLDEIRKILEVPAYNGDPTLHRPGESREEAVKRARALEAKASKPTE